jgi:hypothetical protein
VEAQDVLLLAKPHYRLDMIRTALARVGRRSGPWDG